MVLVPSLYKNEAAVSGTAPALALFFRANFELSLIQAGRGPALELHAQGQAARGEHFLDFVERLAAQVRGLEQLVLGALDQVTDVIDVFGLQAVGGAHGELELVHRAQQNRIELLRAALYRRVE